MLIYAYFSYVNIKNNYFSINVYIILFSGDHITSHFNAPTPPTSLNTATAKIPAEGGLPDVIMKNTFSLGFNRYSQDMFEFLLSYS